MKIKIPEMEKRILDFWKEHKIFQKSIDQREGAENFVFFEGPPTANGRPGIHHVLARAFKDIICRFRTMQGYRVVRKAGWDTHGLPVELQIEKELGIDSKEDIEEYGVAKFNQKCKESVWEYKQEWEQLTERIGYWLDLDNPYITYEPEYIETLWWIIKEVHKKELLYQGWKVVPYCPRCGTSLSSHEVAQGYKKIKEPSIYVKFKTKGSPFKGASLLVWTTTPWTLPGNVAVAAHKDIDYVQVRTDQGKLILAKQRMEESGIEGKIEKEFKGKELFGLQYEPLYPSEEAEKSDAFQVIPGDFVSLDEGTGLVHIAPAFGEEDMEVIQGQNRKKKQFPILIPVNDEGKFKKQGKDWDGLFVKKADPLIMKDLKGRDLLLKEEEYEHDYPFCWRCKTPLLYYVHKTWFIRMRELKDRIIENNQKINWVPSHLKEGRFGEWLRELKDWALSRERYWGTPLPVWQCENCNHIEVIGGREELVEKEYSSNNYLLLRHGHTVHTLDKRGIIYTKEDDKTLGLTDKGKEDIKALVPELKKEEIDLIYASDFLRTQETAKIISEALGVKVVSDKRLRDVELGVYRGRPQKEFWKNFEGAKERFSKKTEEGENWLECRKRLLGFIRELEAQNENKNILLIAHGDPLWLLEGALKGLLQNQLAKQKAEGNTIKPGELRKVKYTHLPFNEKGELDFHRPYLDEVEFKCPKCKGRAKRVIDVVDCWFDSGSMPFAQYHYPFENKDLIDEGKQFPADFISEAVDQTRGWFYTLLAVSTILGKGPAYKNVVSLGHILDEQGEKMSKSKGNIVDPWYVVGKYGADTTRWYLYAANKPGEPKMFSEKEVRERLKKVILTFWNSFVFFSTYAPENESLSCLEEADLENILDRWIISKLNQLIADTTDLLEAYDITGAARSVEDFIINTLSLWYIRRSRRRFQDPENEKKLRTVSRVLGYVLLTLSKMTAPFIPFLSEEIYQKLKKKSKNREEMSQSVHLDDWPASRKDLIDEGLNEKMEEVRKLVTAALAERAKAGIKVRQPLPRLQIQEKDLQKEKELLALLKKELNVKEISFGDELDLETTITPELREEGIMREIVRNIQYLRKKAGFTPEDKISVRVGGDKQIVKIILSNKEEIKGVTRSEVVEQSEETWEHGKEVSIKEEKVTLSIKKVE